MPIGNAATEMTERMKDGVPQANGTTMVEPRMDANDVAQAIVDMAGLSLGDNVEFITIMAAKMPLVGRDDLIASRNKRRLSLCEERRV